MATHQTALKGAMEIEGALGVALVDSSSGMALGTAGSPMDLDLEVAAAGNSNVVQAKMRTMADLGLQQSIEDILITLDKQYHIIRPLARQEGFFLYLVWTGPGRISPWRVSASRASRRISRSDSICTARRASAPWQRGWDASRPRAARE